MAEDYIQGMGFEGSQYVVYCHGDKDHDHIHIVASRIRITDGTMINNIWDYVRSEKLIRELEFYPKRFR
ncbi:relaxase/mobilization nuclease domain-containing protein [Myxosarcina sp. GI1]|uniref:relaxase/mobilization nuclease domain-containing protein n=1 Tax=Myxosarcina sp. GI1 TaxID=1541065 RepID=UPI00352977F7